MPISSSRARSDAGAAAAVTVCWFVAGAGCGATLGAAGGAMTPISCVGAGSGGAGTVAAAIGPGVAGAAVSCLTWAGLSTELSEAGVLDAGRVGPLGAVSGPIAGALAGVAGLTPPVASKSAGGDAFVWLPTCDGCWFGATAGAPASCAVAGTVSVSAAPLLAAPSGSAPMTAKLKPTTSAALASGRATPQPGAENGRSRRASQDPRNCSAWGAVIRKSRGLRTTGRSAVRAAIRRMSAASAAHSAQRSTSSFARSTSAGYASPTAKRVTSSRSCRS